MGYVAKHMRQMSQAMGGMQGMMSAGGTPQGMDMEKRQQRMDLMQGMMQQMLEQMQAQQSMKEGNND